jgi:hypothetical protein
MVAVFAQDIFSVFNGVMILNRRTLSQKKFSKWGQSAGDGSAASFLWEESQ